MNEVNVMPSLFNLYDLTSKEKEDRRARKGKLILSGVSFLDDSFCGIAEDELIVYGARSGAGKTQLAVQLAKNAAKAGKKVTLFVLESTAYEVSRRLKFSRLYNNLKEKHPHPRYGEWVNGLIEESIDIDPEEWERNISIVLRLDSFGVPDLEKHIRAEKLITDLIIIDHLHYLDLEGKNENHEMKEAMKSIRDISTEIKKPIILISHVRKRDKFDARPWPTMDDFHGSSDISKISTQSFSLCQAEVLLSVKSRLPNGGVISEKVRTKTTVFTILKNRNDGITIDEKAAVAFDYSTRDYSNKYTMLEWDHDLKILVEKDEAPHWAKHATNGWNVI